MYKFFGLNLLFSACIFVTTLVIVFYIPILHSGSLFGKNSSFWVVIAMAIPVIHQFFVWYVWRTELYKSLVSRLFGTDRGFFYYGLVFFILFIARPVTVAAVALSNRSTLNIPIAVTTVLSLLFLILSIYLAYSVAKYFGFRRALGADHFFPEYRKRPFVKMGIFRWSNNSMYIFGFLALYIPGLLLQSPASLLIALYNHTLIWVHYFCTEKPDIQYIYSTSQKS